MYVELSKNNALILLICWLREASAHFDFKSPDTRASMQRFLTTVLREELHSPQVCAAARKVQVMLVNALDMCVCIILMFVIDMYTVVTIW